MYWRKSTVLRESSDLTRMAFRAHDKASLSINSMSEVYSKKLLSNPDRGIEYYGENLSTQVRNQWSRDWMLPQNKLCYFHLRDLL
jgi:hypothetical protein